VYSAYQTEGEIEAELIVSWSDCIKLRPVTSSGQFKLLEFSRTFPEARQATEAKLYLSGRSLST